MQGKFIVIDGTDGSGKGTQTKILIEKLRKLGFDVFELDFPQYGKKSAGLVEEYLNGGYGTADEVGPYRASVFFACDRYDAKVAVEKALSEGKIVVANRYVMSNMGHQGGKIQDTVKRQEFFDWLEHLEFEIFRIPRPDLNIILHVESHISQKLVDHKGFRDYIGKDGRDIHEADINHLLNAEHVYLELANRMPNTELIECVEDGSIMSREKISDLVWDRIVELLIDAKIQTENSDSKNTASVSEIYAERITATATLPSRAHAEDAGIDFFADDFYTIMPSERMIIRTGIRMAIPAGYAGLIWDKGGIAKDGIHAIAGVVDAGYRAEVQIQLINLGQDIYNIIPGQKVAQMLIQTVETPEIVESKIDINTERGEGRYGSSGLFN